MSLLQSMFKAAATTACVVLGASCLVGDPRLDQKVPPALPDLPRTHTDRSYNPPGHAVARRKLDLYLPAAGANPAPVIVWIHGGGWSGGDKWPAQKSILAQVARGFAVASVNYRLSGEAPFPAPVQDVKLAVRWVKANAATYHLDPAKVVLGGESAGGHLAALAAVSQGQFEIAVTGWPDSKPKAVIDFVGPTELVSFMRDSVWGHLAGGLLGCPIVGQNGSFPIYDCPAADLRRASVTTYLDSTDPPVFMAYGADDTIVPAESQGRAVAQQWSTALGKPLEESGAVWFDLVEGGGHNIAPLAAEMPPGTPEEQRKTYNFAALQLFLDVVAPR
ncbi:MAG TPA: alpha/beta hydrolase [Polyangiaceae bacterium]